MTAKEYPCRVVNGLLPPDVGRALRALLKGLDGKWVVLSVREKKRPSSLPQKKYYFSVIVPLVTALLREHGNDVDEEETHLYLKAEVGRLKKVVTDPSGVRKTTVQSVAKLTTEEMEGYLERVRAWAAENGLQVPRPNEATEPHC